MTNADFLKQLVEHAERTRGPNAPVAQHLRKQLAKSEHSSKQPKDAGCSVRGPSQGPGIAS
jgi:hypothetical protein